MLKRENLSEKLANIIGKQIIHNELKSGEIIYETQISKEWGVSRSPVRDALHMLEQKRLVEKDPKGSYRVPILTADYIENLYDAENMFYQYAFARATKRITERNLKFLLSITKKIEKSVDKDDFDVYIEEVSTFGRTVLQIAQNPIIEQSALELMPTAERLQFAAIEISPSYLKKSRQYIRESYEHILGKAPQKAAKSFKNFANTSRIVLLNHFKAEEKSRI
jgi:DNA-binding GntR family transcriptional regulator